ncbi:tetratricopeptide repeat protein [Escherichia coli]|nr:SEL1-like repeat protein [Escherichia coli]HAX5253465.1 SEL1-like repeat protein [Escherichia coli]HAZ3859198.1 SEL1-like repeat protein [Escherichia coli]HBN6495800.1 SEL1-like repeat protein [Escherichia coli]
MKKLLFAILFISVYGYANIPEKMSINEIITRAVQGDAEAQARLGEAYLNGNNNQTINYTQAFEWLTKSAASGNSRAKLGLGILYLNGYGEPFDYTKALAFFKQADALGEMKAARYLGIIYERGLGVTQDYKKAAEYYKKGDKNNDITAQYRLAKLYEQGNGVKRDYQQAINLYLKHINRMDHITAPSFVALGDIYSLGLGVEKNPQLAEKWYQKAIDATNTQHNQEINH